MDRGDGESGDDDYNPYAAPKGASAGDVAAHFEPRQVSLATLPQRLGGAVIDTSLLLASMAFCYSWLESLDHVSAETTEWLVLFSFTPVELVQAFLVVKGGQSIGKRIVKTRIVLLDGSRAGFVRGVLLRWWLWYAVSFIPLVGTWIGLETLLVFRRDRRALHDLIAGTRVIRA